MSIRLENLQSPEISQISDSWKTLNKEITQKKLSIARENTRNITSRKRDIFDDGCDRIIKKIFEHGHALGEALKNYSLGSPTLNQRIAVIGSILTSNLHPSSYSSSIDARNKILRTLKTIDATQVDAQLEATLTGSPYRFIKQLNEHYKYVMNLLQQAGIDPDEYINNPIFALIGRFGCTDESKYKQPATETADSIATHSGATANDSWFFATLKRSTEELFGSIAAESNDELSRIMLELSLNIEFSENMITIRYTDYSDLKKFETLLQSSDPNIRKFAYMISMIVFFVNLINDRNTVSPILYSSLAQELTINRIYDGDGSDLWKVEDGIEEFPWTIFDHDYTRFLTTLKLAHIKQLFVPEPTKIPHYELTQYITSNIPENWQNESLLAFETLLELNNLLKTSIHKDFTDSAPNLPETVKSQIHRIMDIVEGFYRLRGFDKSYPSHLREKIAQSTEDFRLLTRLSDYSEASEISEAEEPQKKTGALKHTSSKKTSAKKSSKQKRKAQQPTPSAAAAEEPDLETLEQPIDGNLYLSQVWRKTNGIIENVTLDHRVNAWFLSRAEGVASRASSRTSKIYSEEQLALTHRLPVEVLHLCFHDCYSRFKVMSEHPEKTTKTSLVKINEKMHTVEMTMDKNECIYHFFARPMNNLADYFSKTGVLDADFPPLGQEVQSTHLCRDNNVTLKTSKNIEISFEGNSYEVVYLGEI